MATDAAVAGASDVRGGAAPSADGVPAEPSSGVVRLVVADDSPAMRDMLRVAASLTEGIVIVAEAADGIDAVEACRHHQPDAVILDVEMPRLTGIDAIGAVRESAPRAKIALFSADDTRRPAAEAAGADAYFLKGDASPLDILAELVHIVQR